MQRPHIASFEIALLAGVLEQAQTQPREKIDVSKPGPRVGERLPAFSLQDPA
jgi:hypothetical protein